MDTVIRALVMLALISYSVFRLVRYFRYGLARRVTAVPPSTWGALPATETRSGQSAGMLAGAISVLVFVAANAILWSALLGWSGVSQVPIIWRLFVGIFANFYLWPLARTVGERYVRRTQ